LLIKIINFKRKSPRRPADLRRLFGYLFTPQMAAEPDLNRLLGPPELTHLVLTHRPWGEELELAANDLANQLDSYTREAGVCQRECAGQPGCKGIRSCLGTKRPPNWYTHIVFSFAPMSTPDLTAPPDTHKTPRRHFSPSANAVRIAKDALDFMGWSETQPAVFVVHGDKAHTHVHVVTTVPVFGGGVWDVFRFSRQQLFEIAKICTEAFELSTQTPMLQGYYRRWTNINNAS